MREIRTGRLIASTAPFAMFVADTNVLLGDFTPSIAEALLFTNRLVGLIIAARDIMGDMRTMFPARHLTMVHEHVIGRDAGAQAGPANIAVGKEYLHHSPAIASETIAKPRFPYGLFLGIVGDQ